jgi:hypothetical protein
MHVRPSFTLPPGACPAEPFSYLCVAEPEPLQADEQQPKRGLLTTHTFSFQSSMKIVAAFENARGKDPEKCATSASAPSLTLP